MEQIDKKKLKRKFVIKEPPSEKFNDVTELISWYKDQRLEKELEFNEYLRNRSYGVLELDEFKEYNKLYYEFIGNIDRRILNSLKIISDFSDLPLELQCELEDLIWKEKSLPTISESYYSELVYIKKIYDTIKSYEERKD